MRQQWAVLALVGLFIGCVGGYLVTRPRKPAEVPVKEVPLSSTGPLPLAPGEPIPCRILPDRQLVLLYPAAAGSASPLALAPLSLKDNAITAAPPGGEGEKKAWVYLVYSETEPEVAVTLPPDASSASETP